MCRNITTLRGLQPEATQAEIEAAALQYVRKVGGVQTPVVPHRRGHPDRGGQGGGGDRRAVGRVAGAAGAASDAATPCGASGPGPNPGPAERCRASSTARRGWRTAWPTSRPSCRTRASAMTNAKSRGRVGRVEGGAGRRAAAASAASSSGAAGRPGCSSSVMCAARDLQVSRDELLEFVRPRHHGILATERADGSPQLSPVTMGVDAEGRIVVSTYPERAKAATPAAAPGPPCACCRTTSAANGCRSRDRIEVLDLPEGLDALVEYYRCISGEHPDWDEYRSAMQRQGKVLLRLTIDRWGPVSRGGFPPGRG